MNKNTHKINATNIVVIIILAHNSIKI